MALGAAPERVRRMVLGRVLYHDGDWRRDRPRGGNRDWACCRVAYELKGWDPLVLAASAVALAVVALGAGLVSAARASRICR